MIFNYKKLNTLANRNKIKFRKNKPFPHIAIDNFISDKNLNQLLKEFPNQNDSYWKLPQNRNQEKRQMINNRSEHKISLFKRFTKEFYYEISSAPFLSFLEKLTSTKVLLPDPYLAAAGYHNTLSGGYLNVHADFSTHDYLKMERRLNFLLYLNKNWNKNYNGNLDLYDKKINIVKSYQPIAKRLVIFETTTTSFHGLEKPLECPDNVTRKALSAYYYTKTRPYKKGFKKHTDIFPRDLDFKHKYPKRHFSTSR